MIFLFALNCLFKLSYFFLLCFSVWYASVEYGSFFFSIFNLKHFLRFWKVQEGLFWNKMIVLNHSADIYQRKELYYKTGIGI